MNLSITSEALLEATKSNTSFSRALPGLQLAVDSTSLGEFKLCPRRYFYTTIMGYQPRKTSVHLTFGILLHSAREGYDRAKARGATHEDALAQVVEFLLRSTWDRELQRPWNSEDPNKNRLTLLRTAIWYLDDFGENDPLETVILANGKPAVELSFTFNPGWISASTGEQFALCGHMDRIAKLAGVSYVVDLKSTKDQLSPGFFAKFTPDNQFSLYTVAAKVVFDQPVKSLIVDGCQILATGSRFARGLVERSPATCDEWLQATHSWLGQMELCAEEQFWPLNDKNCGMYGGCAFREICSKDPGSRQLWLDKGFAKRIWDPLQRRGDV